MKKVFRLIGVALVASSLLTACNTSDPQPSSGKYGRGTLIINEGNFSQGNGSLSFMKEDGTVQNGIFEAENNGNSIGGIIQSVRGYSLGFFTNNADKLAIVTNAQDKVIICDADTLKAVAVIQGNNAVENPQAFASIGDRGLVTNWGPIADAFGPNPKGFLTEINLRTRTFVRKIQLNGVRPQGIVATNNKFYVADNNSNKILIFDSSGNPAGSITVANQPDKLVVDALGKIWVICNSNPDFNNFINHKGTLVKINPNTDQVETTINNVPCEAFNSKIATAPDRIFVLSGKKVIAVNTDTNNVFEFVDNTFSLYGLGVNPFTQEVFVGENVFTQASRVRQFSASGNLIREVTAGVGTNGFLFYR
ncbi:MAG: hypothetical protein NZ516_06295 [Raineya sp.]|nr:hypothetical protein [Raineya sp.]